jgi:hypothetical protein
VERTTRIEVAGDLGRWDACALLAQLAPYRSFLVQHGSQQWVVHAETPGCHGEDTASALAAIEECLEARGVDAISIRIDGMTRPAAAKA